MRRATDDAAHRRRELEHRNGSETSMGYIKNFDREIKIVNGEFVVTGSSEGFDDVTTLISRHVAIQQGAVSVGGPATLRSGWKTEPPLSAAGFTAGKKVQCTGTEVYLVDHAENPKSISTYVTLTWTQEVLLTT
jgi:hypothetical protein